jgi:hypothetical protein
MVYSALPTHSNVALTKLPGCWKLTNSVLVHSLIVFFSSSSFSFFWGGFLGFFSFFFLFFLVRLNLFEKIYT